MDGLSKLARSAVMATGCSVYDQLWDEGAGDWRRSGAVMGGLGWTYAQRGALTREAANAAVILREGTAPIKQKETGCASHGTPMGSSNGPGYRCTDARQRQLQLTVWCKWARGERLRPRRGATEVRRS